MLITSFLPDERGKTPVGNSVEKHLGYPQGKRGENFFHKGMGESPCFVTVYQQVLILLDADFFAHCFQLFS